MLPKAVPCSCLFTTNGEGMNVFSTLFRSTTNTVFGGNNLNIILKESKGQTPGYT